MAMKTHHPELERIRNEYARRSQDQALSRLYTLFNLSNLFTVQNQERIILQVLKQNQFTDLAGLKILDLGSGDGYNVLNFIRYGAQPYNIVALDLLADRLAISKYRTPSSVSHIQANGGELPLSNHSFDLIFISTVFTSILSADLKQVIASEAERILTSNGLILVYDFRNTPNNPNLHGVTPAEIRQLFTSMTVTFQPLTLITGITRRVIPYSWLLCSLLERFPPFTSHYLAAIRP